MEPRCHRRRWLCRKKHSRRLGRAGIGLVTRPPACHNVGMSLPDILGPDGAIARALPGYEARRQQSDMAAAVADAIATKRHLVVEAGTGVGKSFAYLVPAMQAASEIDDFRVVISTHTINLQEQLIAKDIPFLQRAMPKSVRAVLVKG